MSFIKDLFLWLWQLPQHLLALIIYGILKAFNKILYSYELEDLSNGLKTKIIITKTTSWGVSLGYFIFLDQAYVVTADWRIYHENHERGHSRQSKRWGPLYLPVVGLASGTMNLFSRIWPKSFWRTKYYKRWPENEANELGGNG